MRIHGLLAAALLSACATAAACGSSSGSGSSPDASTDASGADAVMGDSSSGAGMDSSVGEGGTDSSAGDSGHDASPMDAGSDAACANGCSADDHAVVDCTGKVVQQCAATQACDVTTVACADACQAVANGKQSVGCDFYATNMEMPYPDQCFAAYVVNTWGTPVHIAAEYVPGTPLTVASFGVVPSGVGPTLTYTPYDAVNGLAVGEAAILFLAGAPGGMTPCPVPAAIATGANVAGTGTGTAFHITTDAPVTVYEIDPYGGGSAAVPGASLLLPTSAWDTNYVAVTAAPYSAVTMDSPSLNIVAATDGTQVTLLPVAAIVGGGTLPAGPAGMPYTFTLNKGQQAQLSQQADLSGSVIQSSAPIGLMAGNACMQQPAGTNYCDHGEQMIPPVRAVGSTYVGVMFRPRVTGDQGIWRLVGMVDGTQLTYSSSVSGPSTLSLGQSVVFDTDQPFIVSSQDSAHPFMLFLNMSGSEWTQLSDMSGYGDPDFVLGVPVEQFGTQYALFADPTFPENDLVVVRAKDAAGAFQDVTLDCAGVLTGWQAIGAYEWTRIDLLRHDFQPQGSCSAGWHSMTSSARFGATVWGWGSPETTTFTANASYGYPAGMGAAPVNSVVVPAM